MNHVDPLLRPRVPTASGALLSAALGGLLCLTPACQSGSSGTPDTGSTVDAGTGTDASPATDTAPVDSAPQTDAQPDVVADAATADAQSDAAADSAPLDAPSVDAATDDVAAADATAVDAVPPCDVVPDRAITYSDAATDVTLESFTALCTTRGGHVEIPPHCGGFNTCAGFSYDDGRQTWTEHTCAGLNTCTGFSCVIP